ncbi:MAG TPA: 2-oxoglutarate dehydrogenase E1 component, partial [Firmicutes bacterium]|nr:2-oxoglutarate dehydrogenase E1 component [Bacillota bacterium]
MTDQESAFNSLSLSFVEGLYAQYLRDPQSVAPDWRRYFEEQRRDAGGAPRASLGPSFRPWSVFNPPGGEGADSQAVRREATITALQHRVDQLIRNYRVRGHRVARLDPLGSPLPELPELEPAYYGFTESEMELEFSAGTLGGEDSLSLREILQRLRATYCRSIGAQFMHIDELSVREWLQRRMEGTQNRLVLSREEQLRILTRLTDAVIFEEFIQRKYVGAKRFSLEGAESLIPLLDLAIEQAGRQGYEEIVIGMAHRGRINVLANILGKSPALIFREFEDREPEAFLGGGDVKYHLGYHGDWDTAGGHSIHLALCFNPSHLEFVNAVAMGRVRAKQDRLGDLQGEKSMLILIHGDAAFVGEGIVQETLNLSELEPYRIGGALHVIVNNQIGFTTTPEEGRSSVYASDVAKMLQSPIFHVNGEDPEAVAQAVHLAMEFHRTFRRDVFIDMYCYRRYGHNETDEPAFTHPVLYRKIQKRKSVREGYLDHLLTLGGVTLQEAQEIAQQRRNHLEREIESVRSEAPRLKPDRPSVLGSLWKHYCGGRDRDVDEGDTGVERSQLLSMLDALSRLPAGFHPHPKIKRFLEQRRRMAQGDTRLDWAAGEALAFASLAIEGTRVRLTGQDSRRGTFSQRHAVLYDFEDGRPYESFQHLSPDQAPVQIFNSPLSEAGVVAFEYGYSIAYPDALVMWEAQFGDFLNAAQVVVDQFIAGAEDKWKSLSGLVLLLPHGFEGMGPEHSSAR